MAGIIALLGIWTNPSTTNNHSIFHNPLGLPQLQQLQDYLVESVLLAFGAYVAFMIWATAFHWLKRASEGLSIIANIAYLIGAVLVAVTAVETIARFVAAL